MRLWRHGLPCGGIVVWVGIATLLGFQLGHPVLLPVLQTLPVYVYMIALLRRGAWRRAIGHMLVWAAALALWVSFGVAWAEKRGSETIIYGEDYRRAMFQWIRTGVGEESDPRRFLPRHLRELILFTGASLLSASLVSMHGGAVLMNYMSYYVGSLMRYSHHPVWVFFVGWKIYAVIRVIAYVILGVLLAEPLLSRWTGRPIQWRERRGAYGWALLALLADVVLKTLLAPHYRVWLQRLTELPEL